MQAAYINGMTSKPTIRPMASDDARPFFLVVIDEDREVFCIEGPMTDDRPWQSAARSARDHQHRITCGPRGQDRDELATELRSTRRLAGVPPGSVIRPAAR